MHFRAVQHLGTGWPGRGLQAAPAMQHLQLLDKNRAMLVVEGPTFVRMLPCELGHGVSDLASDWPIGLVGKTLEQFCADSVALGGVECEEQIGGLPSRCLSWFRRLASEDD